MTSDGYAQSHTHTDAHAHRAILQTIAHRVMLERGLLPDFSPQAQAELARIHAPAGIDGAPTSGPAAIRDLTHLLWCSIDNDDSLDLDQLTVADVQADGRVKVLVAIADVDSLVKEGSAINEHAAHNTTSVYTAAQIFPMLPEKLSTDLTSLAFDGERLAVVVELVMDSEGALAGSDIYRARVLNRAKLAYNSVAAWLEGNAAPPEGIRRVPGLDENLRVQDRVSQSLKNWRHVHGALSLETIESRPVFDGDQLSGLQVEQKNRARELVEDLMIAANGVTARYLTAKGFPSIRRVVRTPKRWPRIVELAQQHGYKLPDVPDAAALEQFLVEQKRTDPLRFPDLSLAVVKLMGAGEYAAELPEGAPEGHFGLAVKDYAHSTAPNRRYPDLVTQRLVKAALAGRPAPYTYAQLEELAQHFTEEEDAANKVERQVEKSADALFLENRIGEHFEGIVTGAADKGTWVRLISLPVEGKLMQPFGVVDVGDRINVQLVSVDVDQGYIDFRQVGATRLHRG